MQGATTFRAYVFDAYGTLFDVHSAVRRHAGAVGPRHEAISELWRVKQLEYTWVRTLMGRYVDFWQCTTEALDHALRVHGAHSPALADRLLASYRSIEPYPEVAETLRRLRWLGATVAILSNGTPEMLATACSGAGIAELVDAVVSVDSLGRYKTDPKTYALVSDRLGVAPAEVSFQSSNAWDVAGAAAFGFRAVHVNRRGLPREYVDVGDAPAIADLEGIFALA